MKKVIKYIILISFIIVFMLFTFLNIYVYVNKKSKQVPVLVYHNIVLDKEETENDYDAILLSDFEEQMKYLKDNGYTSLNMKEVYDWKSKKLDIPKKSFVITFDDGYYSFKYLAKPILEKYGFNAICFVIGNVTNMETPEYVQKEYGTIGKDEIYNHSKYVEYGSHTYSMHEMDEKGRKKVNVYNSKELDYDIKTFHKNVIKTRYVSYPFYTYSKKYIRELKKNGYILGFAGENVMMIQNDNNLMIPRISAAKDMNDFKEIFESDKYKNIYGTSVIGKVIKKLQKLF